MTLLEMLSQDSFLKFLGVSVVLCILVMLIVCISLLRKILRILEEDREARAVREQTAAAAQVKNTAIIAAITSAVNQYRKEYSN